MLSACKSIDLDHNKQQRYNSNCSIDSKDAEVTNRHQDQPQTTNTMILATDDQTNSAAANSCQQSLVSSSSSTIQTDTNNNNSTSRQHRNSNSSSSCSNASINDPAKNSRPNLNQNGGGGGGGGNNGWTPHRQTYNNNRMKYPNYFNNNNHYHHHHHQHQHHLSNHNNNNNNNSHHPNHHYANNNSHNNSNSNNRINNLSTIRQPRLTTTGAATSVNFYELDGQYKFNVKRDGVTCNVVQCPNCVMMNLAQIYQYNGVPWCKPGINYRTQFKDIYHAISAELEHFYHFMKPSMQDYILRKATFFSIANSINKIPKIDKVKYYGSYSSNTYLPVSDIDLVVYCDKNDNIVQILCEITDQLFIDGIIESTCQIIHQSRIPLLKFYDSLTGFPINITVNTPNVMERANYIRENIKPDSYLIKILYFLKYYLLHKGTNQVFHGGIGSYALSLMVISFFQDPVIKNLIKSREKSEPCSVLGLLLLNFLNRYSNMEFIRDNTISVLHPGGHFKATPSPPSTGTYCNNSNNVDKKSSVLKIVDHLEPWRIVTSGSFNSDTILQDFSNLHQLLVKPPTGQQKNHASVLGQAIAVVDSFVQYRNILSDLYRYWFSYFYWSRAKPFLGYQAFGEFIQRRNSFGKRDQDFLFKRSPDGSIQVSLSHNNNGQHPKHHPQRRPQDKRSAFDNESQMGDLQNSRAYAIFSIIQDTNLGHSTTPSSTFYNLTPATSESSLISNSQNGDMSDDNTLPVKQEPVPSPQSNRNKRQNDAAGCSNVESDMGRNNSSNSRNKQNKKSSKKLNPGPKNKNNVSENLAQSTGGDLAVRTNASDAIVSASRSQPPPEIRINDTNNNLAQQANCEYKAQEIKKLLNIN